MSLRIVAARRSSAERSSLVPIGPVDILVGDGDAEGVAGAVVQHSPSPPSQRETLCSAQTDGHMIAM